MFSKATEYALRATIYIAQKSSITNKLSLAEIANAIDSPPSFTAKILQLLTKDNCVINSVRGPNGGFYITDKAKQLQLRKVLEALNENDMFDKCILGLKKCSENKPCPMHFQYKPIKQQLIHLFHVNTIQQLAEKTDHRNLFNNDI
ncbi:MAG: Rrf2 family transcriptional regulator [Chitinophagaceae bacterium]|nr:Rrf2 family transcriptional regulator [Chitinophagaceae bacterium]